MYLCYIYLHYFYSFIYLYFYVTIQSQKALLDTVHRKAAALDFIMCVWQLRLTQCCEDVCYILVVI